VLPILYLYRLSTGDFRAALSVLLGEEAAGLSPPTITRLTAEWENEYKSFQQRDLSACEYVYIWVAGVHFNIRLEEERLCTLVVIGTRADGTARCGVRDKTFPAHSSQVIQRLRSRSPQR